MVKSVNTFSTMKDAIRHYYVGKHQGDTQWFKENFGEAPSLKDMTAMILEKYPEDVHTVTRLLMGKLTENDLDKEWERQQNIEQAKADFGFDWKQAIEPIGDGISNNFPALTDFNRREEYPSVQQAKDAVLEWVLGTGKPILTLAGPTGTGKSHLGMAAALHVRDRGQAVIYREEAILLEDFRKGIQRRNMDEIVSIIESVPWLILDEVGIEAISDTFKATYDRIFNSRWKNAGGLRTLLLTNAKSADLSPRIASRLKDVERATFIPVQASDYRLESR